MGTFNFQTFCNGGKGPPPPARSSMIYMGPFGRGCRWFPNVSRGYVYGGIPSIGLHTMGGVKFSRSKHGGIPSIGIRTMGGIQFSRSKFPVLEEVGNPWSNPGFGAMRDNVVV